MRFGNIELKYGIMLAPMAGFSDRAMRAVCKRAGAEYSVTEMISAKAVTQGDKKTFALAKICQDEGPVGLQLFGCEPDIMAKAAYIVSCGLQNAVSDVTTVKPVAIDINMGCPVQKVFGNGEGSALMKNPDLIYKIVKSVKENTDLPVSVKVRTGVDKNHINAVECAESAESAGASLVCVHGRTREQMYSGNVDRETIKSVKKALNIPVIANGDILSSDDALSMIRETGADGIAIGRGAVGNPFIFSEIKSVMEGRIPDNVTFSERIETALFQLSLAVMDKGERIAVPEARKQIALYLKGFRGAANLRAEINRASTYSEVEKILKETLKNYENE